MEYLDTLIVTFNCGRKQVVPEVFARHLENVLQNSQPPDIIVLSLQEVAPLPYAFLGGLYLAPFFQQFRHALDHVGKSLGSVKYVNIISKNVGMTANMAFVLQEHSQQIQWMETAGVGVGVRGWGNKGAIGLRIAFSAREHIMDLTFIAAHLAPMEDALERRNRDWMNIVRGLVFQPVSGKPTQKKSTAQAPSDESEQPLLSTTPDTSTSNRPSGLYSPSSHLIFAGDLNYRTSSTKPLPEDLSAFPQPTKDDSNPQHFTKLLQKDQLSRELKARRTCHGLSEAPINFPPTYKYSDRAQSVAETQQDSSKWDWAHHRWPSWCDRILYLDLPSWMKAELPSPLEMKVNAYTALPLMSTSDHRPVVLSLSIPLKAIPAPTGYEADDVRIHPPFEIDPNWRWNRNVARAEEIAVGLVAYLGLTWEGNGVLLALLVGAVGAWAIIGNMMGN